MFAIAPTDNNWFEFLKKYQFNSFVNFWTPTPWNITGLSKNSKLYFMLKSPVRKIGGFGEFEEYKNITAEEAWIEFGYRNGRDSKEKFMKSIQEYVIKHSEKIELKSIDFESYEIGCIILKICQFWDDENFITTENYEISFPSQKLNIFMNTTLSQIILMKQINLN